MCDRAVKASLLAVYKMLQCHMRAHDDVPCRVFERHMRVGSRICMVKNPSGVHGQASAAATLADKCKTRTVPCSDQDLMCQGMDRKSPRRL